MAFKVILRPSALRDLDKLSLEVRRRVIEKLEWYAMQDQPLRFAYHLSSPALGEYRYRIGDWRIIFDFDSSIIIVLAIDHRSQAYR